MRLAIPLCALAFGLMITGDATTASAAKWGNSRFCLHEANLKKVNCSYATMERCAKFARPGNAWCSPNYWRTAEPGAARETTGNPLRAGAEVVTAPIRAGAEVIAGVFDLSGQYCLHNATTGRVSCTYGSRESCNNFARPGSAWCTRNPSVVAH